MEKNLELLPKLIAGRMKFARFVWFCCDMIKLMSLKFNMYAKFQSHLDTVFGDSAPSFATGAVELKCAHIENVYQIVDDQRIKVIEIAVTKSLSKERILPYID